MTTINKIRDGEFRLPDLTTLPEDGGPEFNRLVFESSPYLLQHARNPVDWYPWGREAFVRAQMEDKPVFLSIGYSTCHWCHVMEHESFEDPEVASFLKDHFISIKVDREERPDIDHIYMSVCQALTGSGGWPLTVFMTPSQIPFFAGTYFPKVSRWGRPGFLELCERVDELWRGDRKQLLGNGERILTALTTPAKADLVPLESGIRERAVDAFRRSFDPRFGGFGGAPKFPMPHALSFLLRMHLRSGDQQILAMVEKTLSGMYRGGIYDHLGYGFARYSTDERWFAPHFEKMLYDNALLLIAFSEAWQATRTPLYERAAREISTYLLRDMRDPAGGFHAAENADSEGEEGKFYVWSYDEIVAELGEEDGDFLCDYFGVTDRGNWEPGRNILFLPDAERSVEQDAATRERIEQLRDKLYRRRAARVHPSLDDKVLTSWNGLAIAALAVAGAVFDVDSYAAAAREAADFLLGTMCTPEGGLLHRYRRGEKGVEGFLEDYAYLVWGLIELYQSSLDSTYLEAALALNRKMLEDFSDADGGLFFSAEKGERLIARTKEAYDGAIPSGNSVAACNCLRLARMTGDASLEERAQGIFRRFSSLIAQAPTGQAMMLSAFDFAVGPGSEIIVAGSRASKETKEALRQIRDAFRPNSVLLFQETDNPDDPLLRILPHLRDMTAPEGETLVYICRNFACGLPLPPGENLRRTLKAERPGTAPGRGVNHASS